MSRLLPPRTFEDYLKRVEEAVSTLESLSSPDTETTDH
jgi:hypothetical protein